MKYLIILLLSFSVYADVIKVEVRDKVSGKMVAGDAAEENLLTAAFFKSKTGIDYVADTALYDITVTNITQIKNAEAAAKQAKIDKIKNYNLSNAQINKALLLYLEEKEIDPDDL